MIANESELRTLLGISSTITDEENAVLTVLQRTAEGKVKKYIGYDPEQKVHTEFYPRHQPAGGLGIREPSGGVWDVNLGHSHARFETTATHIRHSLQLHHLPVRSVTSVHVDEDARHGQGTDAFGSGTDWTAGDDYWVEFNETNLCRGGMLLANGSWPLVPGSVKVVYRAGYSPDELAGNAASSSTASDGTITTAGVDASGIKHAVIVTVLKGFSTWASLKKKTPSGFTAGPLQSERMGDYSYSVGASSHLISGLSMHLPPEAMEALEEFVHYGQRRI